ncbi:dynein heavy chain 6, axonemal-like [Paramuricea clavata]|uniref:Dynein heavy chain 6, axonemal-like n=1 Tax=Paramuricea clavata TaxID=317549 RepID=A0A6S7KLY3_PARCT|nr:dynein heavy chain 6, axonemal-like [Paramuricea clavata]
MAASINLEGFDDLLENALKKVDHRFHCEKQTQEEKQKFESDVLEKLPEDYLYEVNECLDAVPTIPRPQARPKDEDREDVALRCSWDYFDNASYVEFHLRWFRDSSDVSHAFEHKFNGTAAQTNYENLYEHKSYTDRRTGLQNPSGYEWNKKAFCKVRGRFHGNKEWSMWKSSETIFTGIVSTEGYSPDTNLIPYECPVYSTPVRGNSFILAIHLPSAHPSQYWVTRGVALVTQLPE